MARRRFPFKWVPRVHDMACRQEAAKEYVLQNGSGEFILSITLLLNRFITLHTFVPAQHLPCFEILLEYQWHFIRRWEMQIIYIQAYKHINFFINYILIHDARPEKCQDIIFCSIQAVTLLFSRAFRWPAEYMYSPLTLATTAGSRI
jgi:type IV secretory pathway TraG/TraD family ATPase VirD4